LFVALLAGFDFWPPLTTVEGQGSLQGFPNAFTRSGYIDFDLRRSAVLRHGAIA